MTETKAKNRRRVCVFGGSFDPLHLAHIHMAEEALRQFALDEVMFMPTGTSYHKGHASASAEDRNAIILLAIEGRQDMSLSTLDQSRDGSTYTADTLTILRKEAPENEYFFLLGADSLMHIQNWERPEVIFDAATLIAVKRPGTDNGAFMAHAGHLKDTFGARIEFMDSVFEDISSSHIRELIWRCSRTRDEGVFDELSGLVTKKAARYIVEHGLYTDEDPWTAEEILDDLKDRLDERRFEHTLGVAKTAEKLASRWGEDEERARTAGLLHDCAKFLKGREYINRASMADIELNSTELENPGLIHAKLGAYYARERYNIRDEEIILAVRSHTTGRPDMCLLEEIIYVSDYIEPHRDAAEHLEKYRQTAYEDLQKTVMMIARDTLEYLKKKGAPVDPATEETYNWYMSRYGG